MIEHIIDVKCPYCNNYDLVKLIGANVGSLKYKCINCDSYFTESELFGSKTNSAEITSKNISSVDAQPQMTVVINKTELTDECINKIAAAIANVLKGDK